MALVRVISVASTDPGEAMEEHSTIISNHTHQDRMGMKTDIMVHNEASEVLHLLLQVHRHHLLVVQHGSRRQTGCHLDPLLRPTIPGSVKAIAATLHETMVEEDLHLHHAKAVKGAEHPVSTRTFLATPVEMTGIVIVVGMKDVEAGTMGRGEMTEMIGLDRWTGEAKTTEILDGVEVPNGTQGTVAGMCTVGGEQGL